MEGDAVVDDELAALFRSTWTPLVRALSVAAEPAAAADAVQDAFLQAARHWRKVRTYDDPAGWVRHVAVNRLRNQARSRRRGEGALIRLAIVLPTELTPADLDLAAAIAALPQGQRLAVCLHHLADLSLRDVAAALDISEGTVKSQLHDARANLRRLLEAHDG